MGMAILAIIATGALLALLQSEQDLRDGQTRQYKMVLLDAEAQRFKLTDKRKLALAFQAAGISPTTVSLAPSTSYSPPPGTPASTATWYADPSAASGTALPYDLSVGPYFTIIADGEVRPVTGTYANCAATPVNTFCREVLVASGAPTTSSQSMVASTNTAVTYWIRVSQHVAAGVDLAHAVYDRIVVIQ